MLLQQGGSLLGGVLLTMISLLGVRWVAELSVRVRSGGGSLWQLGLATVVFGAVVAGGVLSVRRSLLIPGVPAVVLFVLSAPVFGLRGAASHWITSWLHSIAPFASFESLLLAGLFAGAVIWQVLLGADDQRAELTSASYESV